MAFITIQNKRIYYQIYGRGYPILFVHGWGGSLESLSTLAKPLSSRYRVILLDLPGFGQSAYPDPGWGIKEYGQLLSDFINEIGLKKINYFGHSFGGTLGAFLAINKPHLLKKLILCAPSYNRSFKTSSSISKHFNWLPNIIKKPIYRLVFPHSDLYKYSYLEKNFRKIITQDLTPNLSQINIPTLILWGENDQQVKVELAHLLNKQIKCSVLKIFPETGHNLPLVYPELVVDEIKKFI